MDDAKKEMIGQVTLDYTRYPGEDFYCDGAVEEELLEIAMREKPERYPALIREKKSWEVLYHLSDLRENIVAWLPIDRQMKVLEVGSGCGAITGCLSRMAKSVTCVDLSRKRSLINAYRHRDCANVTIHVGNFQDIEPDLPADYDYVCLIGAFEYGQSYIDTQTPFEDFYRIVRRHVRPGGHVVIAIENKMGLKYWAGCREDHLGTFFAGLEDYPDGGAVRTFTRGGLERILRACGEEEFHFYYPYPDYKFMTMIYSDRYLPKVGELTNNLRNFDRDRMLLFEEKRVFDMLIRKGLFPLYSNSFLVVTGPEPQTVYSRFSNDRARHLAIRTDIGQREDGSRFVRKFPASGAADAHIRTLAQNSRVFTEWFADSGLCVNRLEEKTDGQERPFVELEYLDSAVTLEELLDECLQKNEEKRFSELLERYLHILRWEGRTAQKGAPIPRDRDLTFPNICVRGDVWTLIDYEWADASMGPEDIAKRALYCYILEDRGRKESPILQKWLSRLGMDDAAFATCAREENAFQQAILREKDGSVRTAVTDMRHLIGNLALPFQEAFAHIAGKRIEVFEDYGNGYSPQQSYWIQNAYVSENLFAAHILYQKGVRGIRLDPAEQSCMVQVKRVCLGEWELSAQEMALAIRTNGETLRRMPDRADGMDSVFFDTSDPNIEVRLDALSEKIGQTDGVLTVEAHIVRLSPDMQEGMRERMTRRKGFWFQK